jgi:PAS domain S-box-containing protein
MKDTLKAGDEWFRAAADASLDSLFVAKGVRDEAGQLVDFECIDANGTALKLLGLVREKVIGQKLWGLLPINRETFFDKYAQVLATGSPLEEEFAINKAEAEAKWLRQQVVRVGDGIAISARDVTHWKESGARLKESEERLRLATEAAHMGAWTWDPKLDRFSFSEGMGPVFGLPRGEGFHTPEEMIKAVYPADRDIVARALLQGREKGTSARVEVRTLWPDGTLHWVESESNFIRDATGAVERGVGILWDVTERKAGELALTRANRALRTLSACNAALISAVSEPELLDTICRLIVDAGGYSMAWVGFAEQSPKKRVRVVAQYGSTGDYLQSMDITWADTEHGRGPTGRAIQAMKTQVHQSLMDDSDKALWRDAALAHGFQSSIALPLKQPSGGTGALTLYARERDAFTEEEVRLLEELADDLAFGIATLRTRAERDRMAEAHQHHEEILRKSLEESIQAIADTVEMRDPYTAGHQKRVAQLAVAIAGDLGLPKDEIHGIHLAASIHDLGKIRIPAEILSRPGKLTDIEYQLIKAHAQAGYDILKGIEFPWPLANIVLQHHERLDGSGYPQGLKGEQILLGARIIAVADVVETMASHRPYRAALGPDLALVEIERGRGTAYDPAVANACLKLFREGRFAFQG